jgi:hypothetical protein
MRMHHSDGNRLLAAQYFTKSLESDPDDVECLNACGNLLDDIAVLAKRENFSVGLKKLLSVEPASEDDRIRPASGAVHEASMIYNTALR